jgi:hypothetical protein
MAPSKRPLFAPPPLTTLDHFFRKPETSNSRSASSSQVQKRVKASHHLSSRHRPRTKRVRPPGAEVIVIDSDDDTPLACTKRKEEDDTRWQCASSTTTNPSDTRGHESERVPALAGRIVADVGLVWRAQRGEEAGRARSTVKGSAFTRLNPPCWRCARCGRRVRLWWQGW